MDVTGAYPWLAPHWVTLIRYIESERVPNALLITGVRGIGKRALAELYSQRLLCISKLTHPCGYCTACQLFKGGTHPDFAVLQPTESAKTITVDSVRQLLGKLNLKGQFSRYRVVIVDPAHLMNVNAANSLLKTMEEPGQNVVMILVTDKVGGIPATLISRCQRLSISAPPYDLGASFLKSNGVFESIEVALNLADGAPIQALSLFERGTLQRRKAFYLDLMSCIYGRLTAALMAEKWVTSSSVDEISLWLVSWVEDLVRVSQAPNRPDIKNVDLWTELKALSLQLNLVQAFNYLDALTVARQLLVSGQLNPQLAVEDLLVRWTRVCCREKLA